MPQSVAGVRSAFRLIQVGMVAVEARVEAVALVEADMDRFSFELKS